MSSVISPFDGLAPLYRKYRPAFPSETAAYLYDLASQQTTGKNLLDVGVGTGQVMLACARHFEQMIGIDPDLGMLDEASEALKPVLAERRLIRLFQSRVEDFTPPEGWKASLVTFSRSFHWVEQDATLIRLAGMTEPNGLVALMSDRNFERCESEWCRAVMELVRRFLGEPKRLWTATNPHFYREWGDVLKASPFCDVERATFPVERVWTYETILGYLYSTSTVAKHQFGDRSGEFEAELKGLLTTLSSEDCFLENDTWEVIVGRKRGD